MIQKSQLEEVVAGLTRKIAEIVGKPYEVKSEEDKFYKKAIKLHEDQKLRSKVKNNLPGELGIKLGDEKDEYPEMLYYSDGGFTSWDKLIPPRRHIGSVCRTDYFYYPSRCHPFNVENNKLVANNKEMLELYPGLKIENVYSALEEGIKKLDAYQRR